MTTGDFEWNDEFALPHFIMSAARIDTELSAVAKKLRDLLPGLRSSDAAQSMEAYEPVPRLLKRYNQLCADLKRWNQFVEDQDTTAYNARADAVRELEAKAHQMRLIHQLNAAIKDIEMRAESGELSAASMFETVDPETHKLIVEATKIADVEISSDLSYRSAIEWVRSAPQLNRENMAASAPGFPWIDPHGVNRDLRNLTPMERAFIDEVVFLKRCFSTVTPLGLATQSDNSDQLKESFARVQKLQADFARWDRHVAAIEHCAHIELAGAIERGLYDKTD